MYKTTLNIFLNQIEQLKLLCTVTETIYVPY